MSERENGIRSIFRRRKMQYRGRGAQVVIYVGKLLRGLVYQSDWKVLPMAALIAGIVSMVVRRDYFLTMEGTMKGALALTCTSIWNGCFNSIQVICRERDIIKREHRSGLHISAYIFSHMVYQALLCLAQTALTLYVCKITGIRFPKEGLFTNWLIVDLGITIFMITYASDMLSLWISCLCRSTTTAMTVMPFILIFQLVFSGGIFSLPEWTNKLSMFSVSNYGMKCIAAQSNYNGLPLVTAWNSLEKVENQEINTTVTLGQTLDFLSDDSKAIVRDIRANEVVIPSADEMVDMLAAFMDTNGPAGVSLKTVELKELAAALQSETGVDTGEKTVTLGEVVDILSADKFVQEHRDLAYSFSTTLGELIELVGRDKMKVYVQEQTAIASQVPAYENSKENIIGYWLHICAFAAVTALLSVIFLEFIDKDKR
ncbi:MAG: ABC transporter permease [Flexilinea sp.]|nr:ABC transporter permease [Flexilinea sp.]